MKTFKEQAQEVISTENVKSIKIAVESLFSYYHQSGKETVNNIGLEILKMVVENSNDFTKDIAERAVNNVMNVTTNDIENDFDICLSEKQAWCIAYQIKNNINVYKY